MALLVMKFGGTSVGDVEKITRVAQRVVKAYDEGNEIVVVVSAMGDMTDRLVEMARNICLKPSTREYDRLLSTGEQISIAMLAMAIHALNRPATSLTGRQVGIQTNNIYGQARITHIQAEWLQQILDSRTIAIVAGFQGTTIDGDITTLGRGGSDTTAVALAAALKADVCEIFTDVDGVYTTDPRIVPAARKLEQITYDEMLELATLGARILHNRAVECAKNYNVPLHVRSSFKDEPGTMVIKEVEKMEDIVISGVAYRRSEAKISILGLPDHPGVAAKIFTELAEENIAVDMIIQNVGLDGLNDMGFTISQDDLEQTLEICRHIAKELNANDVIADKRVAKVSVVGVAMQSHANAASLMFGALAKASINILSITTSEIKISCLIDEDELDKAVKAIHAEFKLEKEKP